MVTDPFNFVVGQIVASASSEIEQSKKAERIEEVLQSMQGFVYLKDWRIAYPKEYLYAKKHKLDYSSLRKTTTSMVLKQRSAEQKAKEVANMRALKSTVYGDRSTYVFVPTVWENTEQILRIARDEYARGMSYSQFCQQYTGAYSRLQREGKVNHLRFIFGQAPYICWSKEKAIASAQKFLKTQCGVKEFRKQQPRAYTELIKHPKIMANLFTDYQPRRQWDRQSALAQAKESATQGFVLEDFRKKYSGCAQFLERFDLIEEVRPWFDRNKEKWHIKDVLAQAQEIADAGGNRTTMKQQKRSAYHFLLKNSLLHLLDDIFKKGKKAYDGYAPQLVLNSTS